MVYGVGVEAAGNRKNAEISHRSRVDDLRIAGAHQGVGGGDRH